MRFSLKDLVLKILDWIHFPFLHNSEVNTNTFYRARRDDTEVEVAFGIGTGGVNHGVWSDKLAKWIIHGDANHVHIPDWYQKGVITNTGQATVNAAKWYSLATITLQPQMAYLILATVTSNSGATFGTICDFSTSGLRTSFVSYGRTTTGSGQGTHGWGYVTTGSTTATVTVRSYGYYTTSHTEGGKICAIPLPWLVNW